MDTQVAYWVVVTEGMGQDGAVPNHLLKRASISHVDMLMVNLNGANLVCRDSTKGSESG
ncbi:hypothetical protein [Micromonospora musae]|nr:hypothetical protein [Micromonospora musae]